MANITPPAVAIINDNAPRIKISIDSDVRKTSACVDAPTVSPSTIVTISISEVLAVSANRLVTPDSFKRFPKNNIPSNGREPGEIKAVSNKPVIGNNIFSVLDTALGGFILISLSLRVVNSFMIGG